MLDKHVSFFFKRHIDPLANSLIAKGIEATHITVIGFLIGMMSVPLIYWGYFTLALLTVLLNRAADGLDGLIASKTKPTQLGAYLDITLDLIFYSAIPFAFILQAPQIHGLPAGLLLYSFMMTGSSFLISALFAEKNHISNMFYQQKSFFYSLGLIEATETTLFFIAILLFPEHFAILSYFFASLCFLTAIIRISHEVIQLKAQDRQIT